MTLLTLGSEYGGWTIVDHPSLQGAVIFSIGVGEDISFDVEIINKYNMRAMFVDPTPRSDAYLDIVRNNFGESKSTGYVQGGIQPVESYDLKLFQQDTFDYLAKALWTSSGLIKFYKPLNPRHVSCSVYGEGRSDSYYWVESLTYGDLVKIKGEVPSIIKLDIEGAAFDVITNMLSHSSLPAQILFELEEIDMYNGYGEKKLIALNYLLESRGYKLVHKTKKEFTYFASV